MVAPALPRPNNRSVNSTGRRSILRVHANLARYTQSMLSPRFAAVSIAATVLAAVASAMPLLGPVTPAFACSIPLPSVEEFATRSAAVAIVEVLAAGTSENAAAPLPLRAPASPPPSISPEQLQARLTDLSNGIPDLVGYGASVEVIEVLSGSLPSLDVDVARRRSLERGIRSQQQILDEARQGLRDVRSVVRPPCPLDFGMARYETGQRYVVVLENEGYEWSTILRYRLEGQDLMLWTHASPDDGAWFYAGDEVYGALLADFPATESRSPTGSFSYHAYLWKLSGAPCASRRSHPRDGSLSRPSRRPRLGRPRPAPPGSSIAESATAVAILETHGDRTAEHPRRDAQGV
jgi:hypothetical protein